MYDFVLPYSEVCSHKVIINKYKMYIYFNFRATLASGGRNDEYFFVEP